MTAGDGTAVHDHSALNFDGATGSCSTADDLTAVHGEASQLAVNSSFSGCLASLSVGNGIGNASGRANQEDVTTQLGSSTIRNDTAVHGDPAFVLFFNDSLAVSIDLSGGAGMGIDVTTVGSRATGNGSAITNEQLTLVHIDVTTVISLTAGDGTTVDGSRTGSTVDIQVTAVGSGFATFHKAAEHNEGTAVINSNASAGIIDLATVDITFVHIGTAAGTTGRGSDQAALTNAFALAVDLTAEEAQITAAGGIDCSKGSICSGDNSAAVTLSISLSFCIVARVSDVQLTTGTDHRTTG